MNATRETLAQRLRLGPLSAREATQLCRALLSAVEAAHESGSTTAHGAITPDSIVLEEGKLVLVAPGHALAADLYAVAAVLYESVSGRAWSPGQDPDAADWSGIPRRLRRALRRALSAVPERRWPDVAAFQRALWVPRPADRIWPAVAVIFLAAAIITTIVLCKPLGLCWERPAFPQPPAPAGRP